MEQNTWPCHWRKVVDSWILVVPKMCKTLLFTVWRKTFCIWENHSILHLTRKVGAQAAEIDKAKHWCMQSQMFLGLSGGAPFCSTGCRLHHVTRHTWMRASAPCLHGELKGATERGTFTLQGLEVQICFLLLFYFSPFAFSSCSQISFACRSNREVKHLVQYRQAL